MAFVSRSYVFKLVSVILFLNMGPFASVYALQPNTNDDDVMVPIDPILSDASSLSCQEEQRRSFVDIAVHCQRKTACVGLFYNNTDKCGFVCRCQDDPSRFNKHSFLLQGSLHVFDQPRLDKGIPIRCPYFLHNLTLILTWIRNWYITEVKT